MVMMNVARQDILSGQVVMGIKKRLLCHIE